MTKIQNCKLAHCLKNELIAVYDSVFFITKARNFKRTKFVFPFFVFWPFRAFVINIYCFGN